MRAWAVRTGAGDVWVWAWSGRDRRRRSRNTGGQTIDVFPIPLRGSSLSAPTLSPLCVFQTTPTAKRALAEDNATACGKVMMEVRRLSGAYFHAASNFLYLSMLPSYSWSLY